MGVGSAMRAAVTSAINDIGSDIVITPYTKASSDSGYSGQVETDGSAVTYTAIPFEEFKNLLKQPVGDLESGGFQLALKYNAVFDLSGSTYYKATYQSETYDIRNIKRYAIDNTLVAWILTMSKRIDDS